jgi:membrane-bound lytic murein transglycosylase D
VAENGVYTVRRGDSVWLIARRLGVDEEILVTLNELDDGGRIHVGQVLRVEAEKPQPVVIAAVSPEAELLEVADPAVPDATHMARVEAASVRSAEQSEVGADTAGEDTSLASAEQALSSAGGEPAAAEMPETAGDTAPGIETEVGETHPDAAAELAEEMMAEHVSDGLIARVEQAEPVSAQEAEEIAPSLPLTVQPDLSADPSDYSVVANNSIEVQAAETLGHYADWLQLRAWRLRQLNGMRYKQPVVIGQRLSLDFSNVSATDFEHRRLGYHRALQETFFKRNRIAGTSSHVIRRGESLWFLARRTYEIPIWLLRQYNPDLAFDAVAIGVTVTVPRVESLSEESTVVRTTTAKAN